MKTKNLLQKNRMFNFFILLILTTATLGSLILFQGQKEKLYYNEVRVLLANQLDKIENKDYTDHTYPFAVYDLTGKVIVADEIFGYEQNETINLNEVLQFDKSFYQKDKQHTKVSFVVKEKDTVTEFVVFLIANKAMHNIINEKDILFSMSPVIVAIILVAGLLCFQNRYLKYRIIEPIREITVSSNAIILGDYEQEVIHNSGKTVKCDEVADLTYGFELMRDELKDKLQKEEQLKKSQKELISCISHDLRTPISTIKAYSEGIRDGIADNPEKTRSFILKVIEKTDILIGMIHDLLEHSNAELRELTIVKKNVYLHQFLEPLMNEIATYVAQKEIAFIYEEKAPNMLVYMDERRITQVINNLLENSIKYIGEKNGKIKLCTERTENGFMLTITDNGMGISLNDQPHIFDKFFRAEKSRSTRIPGSGLGLSICKYIVEEHGGEIWCESKVNVGTCIGFTVES